MSQTNFSFKGWLDEGESLAAATDTFALKLMMAGVEINESALPSYPFDPQPGINPYMRLVPQEKPKRKRKPAAIPENLDKEYNDLMDRWIDRYGDEEKAQHHLHTHLWRTMRKGGPLAAKYKALMRHKDVDLDYPHLKLYKADHLRKVAGNQENDPFGNEPEFYPRMDKPLFEPDPDRIQDVTPNNSNRIHLTTGPVIKSEPVLPRTSTEPLPNPANDKMLRKLQGPSGFQKFRDFLANKARSVANVFRGRKTS